MRRTSFSSEIVFGACIGVPFSYKEWNAMLQLAPRGGDRSPMELEDLRLLHVKAHEAFRWGLTSHRRGASPLRAIGGPGLGRSSLTVRSL